MYLLNPLAFARDLRAHRVPESVKARYMVLGAIVQYLHYAWRSPHGVEATSPLQFGVAVGATAAGVYVCYRANAAGDDSRFVERFVCLAVPLTVWTFLGGVVRAATLLYGLGVRGETYRTVSGGISLFLWVAYYGALRWLIIHASRNDVAGPPPLPRTA